MIKDSTRQWIYNTIAICIAIIFLFPLYWIVINSFKNEAEIFATNPTIWPINFTFKNYIDQFNQGEYSLVLGFKNSLIVAIPTMCLSLLISVPAAYGLARFNIYGKRQFIYSFLLTQLMPATLLLAPMFIMFKNMGITNTFWAPIIANTTTAIPFSVMTLRPFFLSLPKELEDAAKIDGCNTLTAFFKIILPMATPGIIMCAVFSFLFGFGDLIYSLTFISNESMRPLTAGIYNFVGKYGIQWNKIMAFGTVVIIPVVLIFVTLQKYIVGGLTSGAVKE